MHHYNIEPKIMKVLISNNIEPMSSELTLERPKLAKRNITQQSCYLYEL